MKSKAGKCCRSLIEVSDTIRKKRTGSKAVDGSCSNKTCPTCSMAHKHRRKKQEPSEADEAKTLPANIAMVDAFMGILGYHRVTE